jgi:hypothetical protein
MPSETSLNQLVKGAPTANVHPPPPAPLPPLTSAASDKHTSSPDLSALPSSPPTIYLNLLILESSLRSQYLHLVSRRRLNTFFLLVLSTWTLFLGWVLFVKPREDGSGQRGGSVYWLFELLQKLAFMGSLATFLLIWATGQLERGVRWPRRWLSTTNRGLRPFNLRVVVIRRRWYREWLSHFSFLIPLGLFADEEGGRFSDWHLVEHETGIIVEEDLAKGGDYIMLLLLPKSFSPEFRENWEEYRSEYWQRENERRAGLRKKVKVQRRNKARDNGGWKWYTGTWRLMPRHSHHAKRNQDLEKHPHHQHHAQQAHPARGSSHNRNPTNNSLSLTEKDALLKADQKAHRRRSLRRDSSSNNTHSRQSSRSSTPALGDVDGANDSHDHRLRRGSSVSSTASVRRKTRELRSAAGGVSPLTSADEGKVRRKHHHNRPTTPESDSAVADGPWAGSKSGTVRIKREDSSGMGTVA